MKVIQKVDTHGSNEYPILKERKERFAYGNTINTHYEPESVCHYERVDIRTKHVESFSSVKKEISTVGGSGTDLDRLLVGFRDTTVADIVPIFLGACEGGIYESHQPNRIQNKIKKSEGEREAKCGKKNDEQWPLLRLPK